MKYVEVHGIRVQDPDGSLREMFTSFGLLPDVSRNKFLRGLVSRLGFLLLRLAHNQGI